MDQPEDGIARCAGDVALGWCRSALDGCHTLGDDQRSVASYGRCQREPSPDYWLHPRPPVGCVAIRRGVRYLPSLASVSTGPTVAYFRRVRFVRGPKLGVLVGLPSRRCGVYHTKNMRLHCGSEHGSARKLDRAQKHDSSASTAERSPSDPAMVAVGFSPRMAAVTMPRRVATLEKSAIVAASLRDSVFPLGFCFPDSCILVSIRG